MRISDILVEFDDTRQAVLDIVTIMAGEDAHSLPLDAIRQELSAQGIDIDDNALFDLLQPLVIVDNIKDGIVYFNTDSDAHTAGQSGNVDSEVDSEKVVKSMAKKQVKKGLDK